MLLLFTYLTLGRHFGLSFLPQLRRITLLPLLGIMLLFISCKEDPKAEVEEVQSAVDSLETIVERFPMKKVFWGDTHHHTASREMHSGEVRACPRKTPTE